MKPQIRKVKLNELDEFCDVLMKLAHGTGYFPKEAIDHYKKSLSASYLRENLNKFILLAAIMDGEVIGVLYGTPQEGGVGTIVWLLVDPKYQKTGLGKNFFSLALKEYKKKGCHKLKLTVPKEEIIYFYTKQGMQLEGTHLNHWWNMTIWSMGITIK